MAWYQDLARCDYFGPEVGADLRAVGWLEAGHEFRVGTVSPEFHERLKDLLVNPWAQWVFAGFHRCDLCPSKGPQGSLNLFVPDEGHAFIAPQLIVHYIDAHKYQPPDEFCEAVMACPTMRSPEYLTALRRAAQSLFRHESGNA